MALDFHTPPAEHHRSHPLPSYFSCFTEKLQPTHKLIQLLRYAGMDLSNESESTLIKINDWAQNNLIRKGERWEEQTRRFEELKPLITPLLNELGFIHAAHPRFKQYQGALVHGALFSTVRMRVHFLIEEWKQGVRFTDLYFLSGERPLDSDRENKEAFLTDQTSPLKIRKDWPGIKEMPKTECEMMQMVWEQAEIPEEMREEVTTHFINAPMKKNPALSHPLRPNTQDTVEEWLKASPLYGRYLAVSNGPYIPRQDLITKTISGKTFEIDTIGPETSEKTTIAIILDEVARLIYTQITSKIAF